MLNSWLNVPLVLAILGGLMVGLKFYQQKASPHPELVRKLLHVPMGLLTLSFPWLFDSPQPVFVLAGLAIAWLLIIRHYKPLEQSLGSVLGDVKRRSLGEVYFPLSIAILFLLSHGDPLRFGIPMLILALADAIAAVIGVRYGSLHYTTQDGTKSAEGSITFFTVAFLSTHIPLLLFSDTGRAESLLIGLILGLLVMLLEAIAWQGLDNLFIPIGSFLLLNTFLKLDALTLLSRLGVTLVLVSLVLFWRRRTTLNDSALLSAVFIGYLSWVLGGWQWLLPPLIVLLTYPLLVSWVDQQQTPLTPAERAIMLWLPDIEQPEVSSRRQWARVHDIYAVLSVSAGGLLWLLLFDTLDRPELLYPYTLAFAANLAVIGVAGLSPANYWKPANLVRLIIYVLKGWGLLAIPLIAIVGLSRLSLLCAGVALLGTALPAIAYYLTQPYLRNRPTDTYNWLCRTLYTLVGSGLALIPLYWH